MGLDFAEIIKNARLQGIPLEQISIVYEGLSKDQIAFMAGQALLVTDLANGGCIGRFGADGFVAFPERATSVLYLGA